MVQIVIIEPHLLLRLGLASLMACLTSAERIKSQSYDDLYQSPPYSAPTDLVLLGIHQEERINLLIQAARRAHAPKRLMLMSETPSQPPSWTNLPSVVTGYVSTSSSAESILSTIHALLHSKPSSRSVSSHLANHPIGHFLAPSVGHSANHSQGIISPGHASIERYAPASHTDGNPPYRFEVDEAKMLGLSSRQYEVLLLLAQGYPIKIICRQLNISMATTKGHLEALYQRLGVHNRNEAVFVAMAQGASLKMPESLRRES